MPLHPHPTDPNKLVFRARRYNFPPEPVTVSELTTAIRELDIDLAMGEQDHEVAAKIISNIATHRKESQA